MSRDQVTCIEGPHVQKYMVLDPVGMNNGGGGKDDLVHHNLQIMQLKGKRKTSKGIYESKKADDNDGAWDS